MSITEELLIRVLKYLRTTGAPDPTQPRSVKVSVVASELHIGKQRAIGAMNQLAAQGLIVVTERDARGTRTVAVKTEACLCR